VQQGPGISQGRWRNPVGSGEINHLVGRSLGKCRPHRAAAQHHGQDTSQSKRPASHVHNLAEPKEKLLNHRFGDFLDNAEITS